MVPILQLTSTTSSILGFKVSYLINQLLKASLLPTSTQFKIASFLFVVFGNKTKLILAVPYYQHKFSTLIIFQ